MKEGVAEFSKSNRELATSPSNRALLSTLQQPTWKARPPTCTIGPKGHCLVLTGSFFNYSQMGEDGWVPLSSHMGWPFSCQATSNFPTTPVLHVACFFFFFFFQQKVSLLLCVPSISLMQVVTWIPMLYRPILNKRCLFSFGRSLFTSAELGRGGTE